MAMPISDANDINTVLHWLRGDTARWPGGPALTAGDTVSAARRLAGKAYKALGAGLHPGEVSVAVTRRTRDERLAELAEQVMARPDAADALGYVLCIPVGGPSCGCGADHWCCDFDQEDPGLAALMEAIGDLRGSMADGYCPGDVNRILGRISDARACGWCACGTSMTLAGPAATRSSTWRSRAGGCASSAETCGGGSTTAPATLAPPRPSGPRAAGLANPRISPPRTWIRRRLLQLRAPGGALTFLRARQAVVSP
jgi:hypothetical protein